MAYICSCRGVNDDTVREAISGGARCVQDVVDVCAAGAGCGGCHPTIETLITIGSELALSEDRSSAA